MVKISPADVMQDLDAALIWNRLCLKHRRELLPYPATQLNTLYQDAETAIVFCPHLDNDAVEALKTLSCRQIILYSNRPDTAAELLAPFIGIQSLSAIDAVLPERS